MSPFTPSGNRGIDLPYEANRPTTPVSSELSEEEFKKLSTCQKIKVLSRQVYKASAYNRSIPLCFIGCSITKLYNILFSTFWLLFIQSFYPNGADSDFADAKKIYSNVMIASVVGGCIFVPIFGKVADVCNP